MRLCGIIAEYNPFHNGHAHQLSEACKRSRCDYLIACMDGGLTQRGDAALLDKGTRARMALMHGADLVVELPALFAVRPADQFARGGVLTLGALGIDALSFGCETDDLALLTRLKTAFHGNDPQIEQAVRDRLREGKSHARARGEAVAEALNVPASLLASPNVTLALEYMRAADALERPIDFYPIARRGDYHDLSLGEFSSASAIRAAVLSGQGGWQSTMPDDCAETLRRCLSEGRYASPDALDTTLIYLLRRAESLNGLCDVTEGFDNLFLRHAQTCAAREELLEKVKCKRYTYARLNRFCAHVLMNLTQADVLAHPAPEYIRVLGFRRDAQPLMKYLKKNAALPLITDAARLKDNALFRFERIATDLQSLSMAAPDARAAGRDMTEPIVIV